MFSTAMWICCAVGFVFFTLFMIVCHKKRSVQGVYIKNLTSIFFIATAVCAIFHAPQNYGYGLMILLALIFGMMGDIYLDQKWMYEEDKDKYLFLGFISFGIGHVFYIGSLFSAAELTFSVKDLWLPVVMAVIVPVGNLILSKPFSQDFGRFKLTVTLYGAILSFMTGLAITAYLNTKETAFLFFALAGVLFLVSDLELSAMYFTVGKDKNTVSRFVINHATYYLAQYFIALTPALVTAY